ncbi:MAG: tRNA-(ms[2]io[6]A)-hydroxylase [Litorivicinus sp.]
MTKDERVLAAINEFLPCPTPTAWIEQAAHPKQLPVLLIDHANCEKKAAATAMSLIWRYTDQPDLLQKMSQLAREELLHFEQVCGLMADRGVRYREVSAARYAAGLRAACRKDEPGRLVDTLLVGALVEARSCERFHALAPVIEPLDAELAKYYRSLLRAEGRHFEDYLALAVDRVGQSSVDARLVELRSIEQGLIESDDQEFRFHSGPPTIALSA